ncbi:MAG: M14 family zinc carboxypeptidase [Ilumatobacteraceae bacterium]
MPIRELQRHLIRMNDLYQSICRAFADGEISATEARRRVHQLSHTDHEGRTWRVDTTRSGHTASFTDGTATATIDHHVPELVAPDEIAEAPEAALSTDDDSFAVVRRRLRPMLVGVALTAILVAVPIVFVIARETTSTRTNAALPTTVGVDTVPTVPTTEPTAPTPEPTTPTTPAPTVVQVPSAVTTSGKTIDEIPFDTEVEFGRSVLGRPLIVERRGQAGGARVLVVGVIHGNEQAGLQVVDLLRSMELGDGVDLWLLPMVNPDGVAANVRQNANGVDLNRNFPQNWQALGEEGYWEYSGASAGSEPEVIATMALARLIVPDFVIWYHQDYFRISPTSGRPGEIRKRYAELVDLPLVQITGGTYTGTAGSWVSTVLAPNGASMLVEFGASLRDGEAQANADAVLTIVDEFFSS